MIAHEGRLRLRPANNSPSVNALRTVIHGAELTIAADFWNLTTTIPIQSSLL